MKYAVILNSRQSKSPVGKDAWIQATCRAVRHAAASGMGIITSLGMNTWELVTYLAGAESVPTIVVVPYPHAANVPTAASRDDREQLSQIILREFALDHHLTEVRFQEPPMSATRITRKAMWLQRDQEIIKLADVLCPVSLRPNGHLANMISVFGAEKTIVDNFCVDYSLTRMSARDAHRLDSSEIEPISGDYLTHWTRATHSTWPGETSADYYRDIVESGESYPRSAFETLKRILREQKLRATNRHIRGRHRVVSFSDLPPHEAVKLMRWRKRYVRWNFEPYGIAIEKTAAEKLGIRPVSYGPVELYSSLAPEDKPFYQNPGLRGGDWRSEREWRGVGDLDLSALPAEAIRVIVKTRPEKIELEKEVPYCVANLIP